MPARTSRRGPIQRSKSHEHGQQRTQHQAERGACRNQRRRPAVEATQFGQVDALAIQTNPEDRQLDQEQRGHDTPSGIMRRSLVDGMWFTHSRMLRRPASPAINIRLSTLLLLIVFSYQQCGEHSGQETRRTVTIRQHKPDKQKARP
jgi:hypothetical protein